MLYKHCWYACEKTCVGLCGLQNALLKDVTTCGYPVLTPVYAIITKVRHKDQKVQRYSDCACWGAPISGEDSRLVEAWNELPSDSQRQILELLNTQAWDLQISRPSLLQTESRHKGCAARLPKEISFSFPSFIVWYPQTKQFDDSRKRAGFETRTASDVGVFPRHWVYRQYPEGKPHGPSCNCKQQKSVVCVCVCYTANALTNLWKGGCWKLEDAACMSPMEALRQIFTNRADFFLSWSVLSDENHWKNECVSKW